MAPVRSRNTRATTPDHLVVIVGAGFSGIGAGIKLKKNGIEDFVILERADEVGGTWRDNTYPGVAVDIPSVTYSYHFEPNPNWSRAFAPGSELQRYALDIVHKYEIRPHVRLNAHVDSATFDEVDDLWRLELIDGRHITARYLISAHGALVTPLEPEIPGLTDYGGKLLRTQNWDHEYDLTGKRVAVIGTGATALQIIPTIAPDVARLDVFQRTPIWVVPKFDPPIPPSLRSVFKAIPATQKALRLLGIAVSEAGLTLGVVYHQQLPWITKAAEQICHAHRFLQVRDPRTRAKLTPDYSFGCKRPSFSNDYHRAFGRENVALITDSIEAITASGIRTAAGEHREIDAIVLATGFKVFDVPYKVFGAGGVEIQQVWDEQRMQSYEGITLPQFPNFFLSPGPFGVTGYSWFSNVDLNASHAVRVIKGAEAVAATRATVKTEAHQRFLTRTRQSVEHTVFKSSGCGGSNTYYLDKNGDAPFLRPTSGMEAWFAHHFVDLANYTFEQRAYKPQAVPNGRNAKASVR